MAYASYRLHRIGWVAWRWVAEYRGELSGKGVALTEGAARAAARAWLQAVAEADGSPQLESLQPASVEVGASAQRPVALVQPRPAERASREAAALRDPLHPGFGRRTIVPSRRSGVALR